jgi:hypothetical protein
VTVAVDVAAVDVAAVDVDVAAELGVDLAAELGVAAVDAAAVAVWVGDWQCCCGCGCGGGGGGTSACPRRVLLPMVRINLFLTGPLLFSIAVLSVCLSPPRWCPGAHDSVLSTGMYYMYVPGHACMNDVQVYTTTKAAVSYL